MKIKTSFALVFATAVVLGGLPTMTANAAPKQPGVISSEFIYESAPFPQCHASTIVETPNGLVAAWFGGTKEKHPDVGIWVSRKSGTGWTKPVEVTNGIQHKDKRYPTWNAVLFQQPHGHLLLFYKAGPDPRTWWGELMKSKDGGRTWSQPRRLPEDVAGPIKNKPILLPDGRLLCGSSTEHDGWRVHFEVTRDFGRTWEIIGPVNDGKEFGAIQPTILVHSESHFQALCRSQQNKITSISTKDGGKTWSKMTALDLPNPNAGFDAVTLNDGTHLMVYNHTTRKTGGRNRIHVATSKDGKNWNAALLLEDEKRAEFSYPAVIQTADGLVHTTYTWKRQRVKHVVIDPVKLQTKPIVNGVWPAL